MPSAAPHVTSWRGRLRITFSTTTPEGEPQLGSVRVGLWSVMTRECAQVQKRAINLREKFELFEEQWKPKVIAEMNDYQFKLVKLEGDFVWHSHAETDETFFVIEGELRIDLRI